jgi:hypothetical protein
MRRPSLSRLEKIVARAERSARKSKRPVSAKDARSALPTIQKEAEAVLADALPQLDRRELRTVEVHFASDEFHQQGRLGLCRLTLPPVTMVNA